MTLSQRKRALATAVRAARTIGKLLKKNLTAPKKVNFASRHDVKLELDVRSQRIIAGILRRAFPRIPIIGEEETIGDQNADARWVVDPIDGTVNFSHGIPHCCVSIALQERQGDAESKDDENYQATIGVVFDPFCDELWTAIRGRPARLNGKVIRVSETSRMSESIVAIGFAKTEASLEQNLPYFNGLVRRVRRVRMTGVAALALCYVATGRFDAYIETGIWLWDIAAGGLIIECAGGEFWREPLKVRHSFRMVTSNGKLRRKLLAFRRQFLQPLS